MWLWCARALAQTAPGTTDVWWSDAGTSATDDLESVVNASIAGDGTTLWVAMEWLPDASALTPALWLWRADAPYAAPTSTILQPSGSLTGDGMYPSIVTWPGAAQVWVTSKQTEPSTTGDHAHLFVWRQNRDDLSLPPTLGRVTEAEDTYDHGRPHLVYDDQTDEHYLCFTGMDGAGGEDLVSFVKDATTWSRSTWQALSAEPEVDDHCFQAFSGDGTRFAAFHSAAAVAGGDDIWLDITRWNGAAWDPGVRFALQGSATTDFPSLWIREADTLLPDRIYVAAKNTTNDLVFWTCSTAAGPCDSAARFGPGVTLTSDGDNWDPKVFAVPTADGLGDHVFVLYQKQEIPRQVGLLVDCGATGTFVDAGVLPMGTEYSRFGHQELGAHRSSAHPSVYWDGATFHVPFLARHDDSDYHRNGDGAKDDRVQLDLLVYHGDPDDFCP